MKAYELVNEIKRRGVELRVDNGTIIANPLSAIDDDLRQAAKKNKQEIIAILSRRCPSCGSEVRGEENAGYRYVQCTTDPLHYFHLENKRREKPMGLFPDYERRGTCSQCGSCEETYGGGCDSCLERMVKVSRDEY